LVDGASIEKAIGSESIEVAAMEVLHATATKVDAPKATEYQLVLVGSVRCVQVMPSAEVAAMEVLYATATNVDAPKVTDCQPVLVGSVR